MLSFQVNQPRNAAVDLQTTPTQGAAAACPGRSPARLQLALGAEMYPLGAQTRAPGTAGGGMGSHIAILLFAFQNRLRGCVPVAWGCARMRVPGLTEQSHTQMLLAAHADE